MNVTLQSDQPLTDEACRAATGKTIPEWFAVIDGLGGRAAGRKLVNDTLVKAQKVDAWWVATLNVLYEAERGIVEKDGRGKGFNICVTKSIKAPVEKVYEAWTDPGQLAKWFAEGSTCEVTDGGTFSVPNGCHGTYKRVRPNKDLRFTWEGPGYQPSMVDVVLTAAGDKTALLVNLDRVQTRAEADGLRRAWGEAVDRLKAVMESPS